MALARQGVPIVLIPLCNPKAYRSNWRYPNTAERDWRQGGYSVGDAEDLLPGLDPQQPEQDVVRPLTGRDQQVLAFNTTGDLFAGFGAGTIKGAAGVEYREEKTSNIGDQGGAPDYVRNDYLIQYGESFAGKVNVTEAGARIRCNVEMGLCRPN